MLKFIPVAFACLFINVLCNNEQSPGVWTVVDVSKCEALITNVLLSFDIKPEKMNQTQVVFSAEIDAKMDIDSTFGLHVDVCKHVDGGCKLYYTIIDGLEKLVNQIAKDNVEQAFRMAGVDPPGFPIPEGHHVVEKFPVDFCELPHDAAPGRYEAEVFFTRGQERVGCLRVVIEFEETDEELC